MSQVRGARDLVALWRGLPAAVLAYPAARWSPSLGLAPLSDTLRAWAWRDHCAAGTVASCADIPRDCVRRGCCQADALFPVTIGGGSPSWRMATLFVQWRPMGQQLRLIALGAPACSALGWAARCLAHQHGLDGAQPLAVSEFGDLDLEEATRWSLTFCTPWVVGKGSTAALAPPETERVAHELRKALRMRAHKFTALCVQDETSQRLAAHLVHHVADALLPDGLAVEAAAVESQPLALASRGNGATFTALTWSGQAILRVDPAVRPWLTLLATCGGGENADKGFGGIELRPLA